MPSQLIDPQPDSSDGTCVETESLEPDDVDIVVAHMSNPNDWCFDVA